MTNEAQPSLGKTPSPGAVSLMEETRPVSSGRFWSEREVRLY